jgi:membrane protein implicated in regulation of membrane protease activity
MWWESLSSFQQVMFVVAVSSTAVMLIFLILSLIGMDGADYDGAGDAGSVDFLNDEPLSGIAGLKIFTIRGVLVFLSLGAWAAYLLFGVMHIVFVILIAIVVGFIAAFLQALAFKSMMKLESVGNIDYKNAIGKTGTVYMRIPKSKTGRGKITVVLQERYAEVEAVTDEASDIMPKSLVEVVGLENSTTVIVKKKN